MKRNGHPDPARTRETDRRTQSNVTPFPGGKAMGEGRVPEEAPAFAELVAATGFSFLRGASRPGDMVLRAIDLRLRGLGIADRNSVAGVVQAWRALRDYPDQAGTALNDAKREAGLPPELSAEEEAACSTGLRLITGARLVFADDTPDIVAYPVDRSGWGRLTRLLTMGNLRSVKGGCILHLADLLAHVEGLQLIVLPESTRLTLTPHRDPVDYAFTDAEAAAFETEESIPSPQAHLRLVPPPLPETLPDVLRHLAAVAPGRVWLGASLPRGGRDARRLHRLEVIADEAGVPLLATNDVLYAGTDDRPLHDVLTCVAEGTTLAEAGRRLAANGERHLKAPAEMQRLFAACPKAVEETARFLSGIRFDLSDLRYEYPHEPVPEGWEPQDWLEELTMSAAYARYGSKIPAKVRRSLEQEFALIRARDYAYYFLTVHDIVAFARSQEPPILCQGRGSAANSAVCFLLGVTSIDPNEHDLLFSRFVSEDRNEPPDIDVDFEHERREEVMQYIYQRYGRHRAAITGTVIHYRSRSAMREVGKVLGLSEDVTARLASTVWGSYSGDREERRFSEAGFDPGNPQIVRFRALVERLLVRPFPRHLSQHVGGFVLTQNRLDETVPLHHAAMADRTFIEWDKDDIDALGLMKVDVLALGMLTCIRKAFDLMRANGMGSHQLDIDLKADDPAVYDMLCTGDSIGVFQVESRAQINMLPRLKPRTLYDLTIQVAIVRPGPIEGDMVHPYLRRRCGEEKVDFPSPGHPHDPDELRLLLGKTFGVPLFQEQAMRLAIVAAGFSDAQANQLRKAMATFRNAGTIHRFREMMVKGMTERGYEEAFAERCYKQIEGFGSYGFPESHALSFARLVYVSAWIKCHQPAIFACALLNAQPMGFYAPAQIIRDAREHGVTVRPVDVNVSDWDNDVEREGGGDGPLALRLGLRQVTGFREEWAIAIGTARAVAPFGSVEDLARRANLPARALRLLADADGLASLGKERREALWEVRRVPTDELPLFTAMGARELGEEPDAALPAMPLREHVSDDYQMTGLSLKGHPMQFLRSAFRREGVLSCAETGAAKNGARVRTAGVVLVRQRPGKGNAIFITLEDETGIANVLLWARLFEMQRRPVMVSRLMLVEGEVQRSKEGVVHLMASRVHDRSMDLDRLSGAAQQGRPPGSGEDYRASRARHPRNVRIMPKSRDFH